MIWVVIAIGFLVPIAIGVPTRLQPMLVGMAWPIAVAIAAIVYIRLIAPGHATIAIPFYAILSLAGSVPGGLVGWILKRRLAAA